MSALRSEAIPDFDLAFVGFRDRGGLIRAIRVKRPVAVVTEGDGHDALILDLERLGYDVHDEGFGERGSGGWRFFVLAVRRRPAYPCPSLWLVNRHEPEEPPDDGVWPESVPAPVARSIVEVVMEAIGRPAPPSHPARIVAAITAPPERNTSPRREASVT